MGKKETKKRAAKVTLSDVIKEMAKPRVVMSVREYIPECRALTETKPIQRRLGGDNRNS
jgi:hypothetical protein